MKIHTKDFRVAEADEVDRNRCEHPTFSGFLARAMMGRNGG